MPRTDRHSFWPVTRMDVHEGDRGRRRRVERGEADDGVRDRGGRVLVAQHRCPGIMRAHACEGQGSRISNVFFSCTRGYVHMQAHAATVTRWVMYAVKNKELVVVFRSY